MSAILDFSKNFIFSKTAANFIGINRKHVFTSEKPKGGPFDPSPLDVRGFKNKVETKNLEIQNFRKTNGKRSVNSFH